jgi:hypothetical protein
MTLSAIPAPRENWTRYPNAILDNLDQFSGSELKVVSCVVRQNVGFYGNPNYRFSVAYVAENTGLSELTASRALRGLAERGTIILLSELGPVGERQYAVNWEIESDESAPIKSEAGLNKLTDSPLKSKGRPPKKVTGIKETNTKKQSKETNTGFSKNEIRELTDHLLEIRPELREKTSDWWAQQIRHVQSVRKIFPTLTVEENLYMGSVLKKPKSRRSQSLQMVKDLFPVLADRFKQAGARCPAASNRCWQSPGG